MVLREPRRRTARAARWVAAVPLLVLTGGAGGPIDGPRAEGGGGDAPIVLPPVVAVGVRVDTFLIGGYASGTFEKAVRTLSSELDGVEGRLVGEHLHRIFAGTLPTDGLGTTGRLRIAYERAVRPDGTTRSIRVLGAEVAVAGRIHTALHFERDGRPGYFDPLGTPLADDEWLSPLAAYRITSPFARRRPHPVLGRVLPHTGIDLAAPAGTPVVATADGAVTFAGDAGGYGNVIELRHANGYATRYAHLSAIASGVRVTGLVRRGDVIGYVGASGLATGPHLHYEVRRRGQPIDPTRLASAGSGFGPASEDPGWPAARSGIERLLSRAPTVATPDSGPAGPAGGV